MIWEPHPGTPATNKMNSNSDIRCLGTNFIVMAMIEKTADVYQYYTLYEPIYNFPIVAGVSTYIDINTNRLFIIFMNEAFYYVIKLVIL